MGSGEARRLGGISRGLFNDFQKRGGGEASWRSRLGLRFSDVDKDRERKDKSQACE